MRGILQFFTLNFMYFVMLSVCWGLNASWLAYCQIIPLKQPETNIEDWVKMLRSLNPQSNNIVIFGAFQVMNDWNTL